MITMGDDFGYYQAKETFAFIEDFTKYMHAATD
jgi:hypothetical protein